VIITKASDAFIQEHTKHQDNAAVIDQSRRSVEVASISSINGGNRTGAIRPTLSVEISQGVESTGKIQVQYNASSRQESK
jgi:hypothetical protein